MLVTTLAIFLSAIIVGSTSGVEGDLSSSRGKNFFRTSLNFSGVVIAKGISLSSSSCEIKLSNFKPVANLMSPFVTTSEISSRLRILIASSAVVAISTSKGKFFSAMSRIIFNVHLLSSTRVCWQNRTNKKT